MSVGVDLAVTMALLTANAFLAADKSVITSTRRSQAESLTDEDARGTTAALYALQRVPLMLVIYQLGMTVTSAILGVVMEPAVAHLTESPLGYLDTPEATSHIVGSTTALVIVPLCHVVLDEIVPKNALIAAPVRMLLILVPVPVRLDHILRPIIEAMDRFANWFMRLTGYEPHSEVSTSCTIEEVALIVAAPQEKGVLTGELGLLDDTLESSKETVGAAVVPLDRLIVLPEGATSTSVEEQIAHMGYPCLPIVGEDSSIVGCVHLKDVLCAAGEGREQPITPWRIRRLETASADNQIGDTLCHI